MVDLKHIVLAIAALTVSLAARCQTVDDTVKSDKIKLTPTGRALVDAATYITSDDRFKSGAAIPEARLGVRGEYGSWTGRVEVGVSYGKLALKDIWIQTVIGEKFWFRVGNFIQPFGLQSTYNASMKSTMEMPPSNSVFDLPRQIGIRFKYFDRNVYTAVAAGVESRSSLMSSSEMGHSGWGLTGRGVWRIGNDSGAMLQVGLSGAYLTPQYNDEPALNHKSVSMTGMFPTSVSRVTALGATVDDARGYFKFTPELMLMRGRFALESQYYHGHVFRHDANDFDGYGFYAILRGLVKGDGYAYRSADARIETPDKGALELALCYNYTCLTDRSAVIFGGRVSDISCTFNWYINKYVIWRVRAGFTHAWDRADMPDVSMTAFQTRLQIIF